MTGLLVEGAAAEVRPGGHRRRRRGREVVVYAVVAVLAAGGAAFATRGLWRDSVQFERLSWLGKDDGQITGVDPETGKPEGQLRVGDPGDVMTVAQGDNVLIVTNTRTGEVTVVALPDLRTRAVGSGKPGDYKVLLAGDRLYVAGLADGSIRRIDSSTAATIGQPWFAGTRFIDAVADDARRVWVLGMGGALVALRWSEPDSGFSEDERTTVEANSPRTVLVGHDSGVTALDPVNRVAVRVGAGDDQSVVTTYPGTSLLAADRSPANLVPFSAPGASAVLLIRDGQAIAVDTGALGCRQPGKPVVYRGKVYASCRGAGKVIVLDRSGQASGAIATPGGGDAVLVLSGGRLIVNDPYTDAAVMIGPDGSTRTIRTDDPDVRPRDARPKATATSGPDNHGQRSPGAAPARPGPSRTAAPAAGGDADQPPAATAPSAGAPAATPTQPAPTAAAPPPPPPPDYRPTNVSALALSTGSVRVTWTSGGGSITGYRILHSGTGAVLTSPAATATSATISGLAQGQAVAFYVEALTASGTYRSAVSNTIYPYREPPPQPPCRGCQIP